MINDDYNGDARAYQSSHKPPTFGWPVDGHLRHSPGNYELPNATWCLLGEMGFTVPMDQRKIDVDTF